MSAKKKIKKQTSSPKVSTAKAPKVDIIFIVFLALLTVLIYVIRIKFLDVPMERDEGDYGLAGKLILEGAKPYIDVFEQKPPGLFYSYAFVEAIFGTTISGLKTGFAFVNMATVVLLACGLRYFLTPLAGIIAGCTFAIVSLNPYASGFTVQAEHLLIFFVTISFFFLGFYKKTGRLPALVIAGAMVAWSAMIKQNGIFFIAALTLGVTAIHLARQKLDAKKLFKEYVYFGAGGVGIVMLVMLSMALQGVWKEFIFWSVTFPREFYVSSISFDDGMTFFKMFLENISAFNSWIWYGSIAGLISIYFSRISWSIKVWISVIYIFAFFSIWPGFRFYGHYWIQWFFAIAIAMGSLAHFLGELLERKLPRSASYAIPLLFFLVVAIASLAKNKEYYLAPNPDSIMNLVYGDNPFMESKKVAEFINSKNPDVDKDKLLVIGSEPQILLETGLKSPTAHTFIIFVASSHAASVEWRREYLEMLNRKEAKYAVFVMHPYSWIASTDEAKKFVGQVYSSIMQNYKVIGIADIISTEQTIYKWDQEAATYNPKSANQVVVYERK